MANPMQDTPILQDRLPHLPWIDPRTRRLPGIVPVEGRDWLRFDEAYGPQMALRDRLIAEVQVQPMDIDVVFVGLPAEIRLPAFKQRLVPFLHGVVTFVAADITVDQQTRASTYRAHIRIDAEQLARLPAVFLTPGMPVEAHIQLGSRTFWRYITQPVVDSFNRAFHEP